MFIFHPLNRLCSWVTGTQWVTKETKIPALRELTLDTAGRNKRRAWVESDFAGERAVMRACSRKAPAVTLNPNLNEERDQLCRKRTEQHSQSREQQVQRS